MATSIKRQSRMVQVFALVFCTSVFVGCPRLPTDRQDESFTKIEAAFFADLDLVSRDMRDRLTRALGFTWIELGRRERSGAIGNDPLTLMAGDLRTNVRAYMFGRIDVESGQYQLLIALFLKDSDTAHFEWMRVWVTGNPNDIKVTENAEGAICLSIKSWPNRRDTFVLYYEQGKFRVPEGQELLVRWRDE